MRQSPLTLKATPKETVSCYGLASGEQVNARSVVIASGARYRRLNLPDLCAFEGSSVHYWASPLEAKLCEGQEVVLVGGGNSAGPSSRIFSRAKSPRCGFSFRGPSLAVDHVVVTPVVEPHREPFQRGGGFGCRS